MGRQFKEKHRKLCWVCDACNWLQVSDSKEHHQMDFCKCKDLPEGQFGGSRCGVDLESYMCRFSGHPRVIAELEEGKYWKVKLGKKKKTFRLSKDTMLKQDSLMRKLGVMK